MNYIAMQERYLQFVYDQAECDGQNGFYNPNGFAYPLDSGAAAVYERGYTVGAAHAKELREKQELVNA